MSRDQFSGAVGEQVAETQRVLVNLGCGVRYHRSWKNLDLHSRTPDVTACNFLKGIPFDDASVDAVYCAAVLEHIAKCDAERFLAECHRVLKRGGILRISVPDFEEQTKLYLKLLQEVGEDKGDIEGKLDWLVIEMLDQAGRDQSGGFMAEFLACRGGANMQFIKDRIGKEGTKLLEKLAHRGFRASIDLQDWRSRLVRGGPVGVLILKFLLRSKDIRRDLAALEVGRFRLFSGEVHRWAYSYATLAKLFERQGFSELRRMPHGVSRIAGWKEYQLEVDSQGQVEKPDLFIIEGRKP